MDLDIVLCTRWNPEGDLGAARLFGNTACVVAVKTGKRIFRQAGQGSTSNNIKL